MTTLALDAGQQVRQIRSAGHLFHGGRVAMETAKNSSVGLQDSQFGNRRAHPHWMPERRSQIANTRIIREAVLNILFTQVPHRSASLGARSEGPLEHGSIRRALLSDNDAIPARRILHAAFR